MKVRAMYSTYFSLAAPKAIEVEDDAKIAADQDVLSPSVSSYKEAEDEIYNLLRNDFYKRFLWSTSYTHLVKGEIAVKPKTRKYSFVFSRAKTTLKHLKWRGI